MLHLEKSPGSNEDPEQPKKKKKKVNEFAWKK